MKQFEKFAEDHNITMTVRHINIRTDGLMNESHESDLPTPVHFQITMVMDDAHLWSGGYSQGIRIAEQWAQRNIGKFIGCSHSTRDFLSNPLPFGKRIRADSQYWQDVRSVYGRAVEKQTKHKTILSVAEVLLSLQMDVANCDQDFADWADDHGFSSDSISAHKIWETCNNVRRGLQRGLGKAYSDFIELEE